MNKKQRAQKRARKRQAQKAHKKNRALRDNLPEDAQLIEGKVYYNDPRRDIINRLWIWI